MNQLRGFTPRDNNYKQTRKSPQSSVPQFPPRPGSGVLHHLLSDELLGEKIEPSWKLDGPL